MEGEQLEGTQQGDGEEKKIKAMGFKSVTESTSLCLKTCMSKENDC